MKIDLFRKHVLITEIVTEAGQRRGIVECKRAQATVLGKIDGEMAGNARAPTIADENDLVASIVGLMRGAANPFAALFERHRS